MEVQDGCSVAPEINCLKSKFKFTEDFIQQRLTDIRDHLKGQNICLIAQAIANLMTIKQRDALMKLQESDTAKLDR